MKKLFLTSGMGLVDNNRNVKVMDNTNEIINQLKKCIKNYDTFTFICSNPKNYKKNDNYANCTFESFKLSGFPFEKLIVIDDRFKENIADTILSSDLVFLSGGDTYTEMQFFEKIRLREILKKFDKIIIGQSAGSINMACNVFNSPEEENDLKNPSSYRGLELTTINVEPHFKLENYNEFQRKYILEESNDRELYALIDGSYVYVDKDIIVYGESYLIKNESIKQICENGKSIKLKNKI